MEEECTHPKIVFICTHLQTKCDEVADALTAQGLRAVAIHGGRSQGEREAALRDFRKGDRNILVRRGSDCAVYQLAAADCV